LACGLSVDPSVACHRVATAEAEACIYQVLPALLKKLDIDFTIDESGLRSGPEEERGDSPPPAVS